MEVWICCCDINADTKKIVDSEEKAKDWEKEDSINNWYHGPFEVE